MFSEFNGDVSSPSTTCFMEEKLSFDGVNFEAISGKLSESGVQSTLNPSFESFNVTWLFRVEKLNVVCV